MAQSYKTLKENFVSNLSGGSVSEINYVTAVAPAAYLLWSALQSRQGFFNDYSPAAFLTDFLLNVVAILLATTLYSSNATLLNVLLLSSAAFCYLLPPVSRNHKRSAKPLSTKKQGGKEKDHDRRDRLPIRPFITAYRGGMMIITCLVILAVDFRVFPRRFAKVENWGTSLMDMGVGSFVFSAGLVSARPVLLARLDGKRSSLGSLLHASLRSSIPLLLLGVVRLYSVKGLNYAEHVTEYGVHWNFFFTLAFLPPFAALFQTISPQLYCTALLSLATGGIYEAGLDCTSLKAYILTAPRTDLLSQNREGLFSFCGYLAIFLAGQALGFVVFLREPRLTPKEQRQRLLLGLVSSSFIWSTLFSLTTSYKYGLGIRVSRRLANLPYILWVAAFNSSQITVYCVIETLLFPTVPLATDETSEQRESDKASSRVIKAYNRNGLAIFLLANLMTGIVNMTLDTLSVGIIGAVALLPTSAGRDLFSPSPQEAEDIFKMKSTEAHPHGQPGTPSNVEAIKNADRSKHLLQKMLSTRSVMIDADLAIVWCHIAMRNLAKGRNGNSERTKAQNSNLQEEASPVRAIGWGSCGIIYQEPGMTHVFKRAINRNIALSKECRLLNDLVAHQAVEAAFDEMEHSGIAPPVRVPRLYSYMPQKDNICQLTHARLFAEEGRRTEDLLISERIPPVHLIARQALIDYYCPKALKIGARGQSSNNDCLMQDLQLDTTQYAVAMAEALAIMHWKVKIDAANVEFVLGGQPHPDRKAHYKYEQILGLRNPHSIPSEVQSGVIRMHMWLLDFNQCQPIQMDVAGVDQAVKRFFDNDPYYPRPPVHPDSKDMELWEFFVDRYLVVSGRLVGDKEKELPSLFIKKVKTANDERLQKKVKAAQRSGE